MVFNPFKIKLAYTFTIVFTPQFLRINHKEPFEYLIVLVLIRYFLVVMLLYIHLEYIHSNQKHKKPHLLQ